MQENKHLYDMECEKCGASISLDLDNLIAFCPYCGNKLMVDPVAFSEVYRERERTRRAQMEHDHEREMLDAEARRKSKKNRALLIAAAIGIACVFLGIALDGTSVATALFFAGGILLCGVAWVWFAAVCEEQNKLLGKNDTKWWTPWRR